jgi:hypothetical protein
MTDKVPEIFDKVSAKTRGILVQNQKLAMAREQT